MDNFDLRKYLVEHRVTTNSKILTEAKPRAGVEYLKAAAKAYWKVDLDNPDDLEQLQKIGVNSLPVDAVMWMMDNETHVGSIGEAKLWENLEESKLELRTVAEYQFNEESYNFTASGGAGEYDSTLTVMVALNAEGKTVKVENYDFIIGTDRGSIGGDYALMNKDYVNVLKSISDIFEQDAGWYAGYKDRTKNKKQR